MVLERAGEPAIVGNGCQMMKKPSVLYLLGQQLCCLLDAAQMGGDTLSKPEAVEMTSAKK